MTDQPPNFDDIFEDDDALEKARKNLDGKTIEGDFANASGARPDENKVRKGDLIITGTGTGPGGFAPNPDSEDEPEEKSPPFGLGPDDDVNQPARRPLKLRNAWGLLRESLLAIHDHGDYLRIGGQQVQGPGPKEISDKQLRQILIKGVLEKGWDTFYFYHGNKIDTGTASRAMGILRELTREASAHCNAGPLAGYNVQASFVRMPVEKLPSCFSRAHHERLAARELEMRDRKWHRNRLTENIASKGYS
jgi:hypothetical protein